MASSNSNTKKKGTASNVSSADAAPTTIASSAASSSAAAADYDPRQYQNPHPDNDQNAKTNAKTKAKTTEAKATTKTLKASKDTTGKAAADGSHCCYHCGRRPVQLRGLPPRVVLRPRLSEGRLVAAQGGVLRSNTGGGAAGGVASGRGGSAARG